MRRALAILKYVPAVLCGLLVVAWVVSFVTQLRAGFPLAQGRGTIGIENACFTVRHTTTSEVWVSILLEPVEQGWTVAVQSPSPLTRKSAVLGAFDFDRNENYLRLQLPVPALVTFLIPLAIGPFNRFRFPLWSWFAFTALVAVELAYYLR